jgi:hypothetical protein
LQQQGVQARALYEYGIMLHLLFVWRGTCLVRFAINLDLNPLSSPFFEDPEQEDEIQLKEGDIVVVYERDESG